MYLIFRYLDYPGLDLVKTGSVLRGVRHLPLVRKSLLSCAFHACQGANMTHTIVPRRAVLLIDCAMATLDDQHALFILIHCFVPRGLPADVAVRTSLS
jgi:hypothetical protein